jgi:hypothetical protein
MVNYDCPAIGEGFDRMADATGHDRNQAGPDHLGRAVYRHFEFALDHFVDFFLGVEMLAE